MSSEIHINAINLYLMESIRLIIRLHGSLQGLA